MDETIEVRRYATGNLIARFSIQKAFNWCVYYMYNEDTDWWSSSSVYVWERSITLTPDIMTKEELVFVTFIHLSGDIWNPGKGPVVYAGT